MPRIGTRSPIYPLAEAFRRMAARIDSLIGSQKDMSNAMSHEIKTPLARMRFEIEMARTAADSGKLAQHLNNINVDIARARCVRHGDARLRDPGEGGGRAERRRARFHARCCRRWSNPSGATRERTLDHPLRGFSRMPRAFACDAHLMETVLRNLLYNAIRYARSQIRVTFFIQPDGVYNLRVDDDGPGIPEADRARIFDSFVQLDEPGRRKAGYGLGLAIVKRIVEWHGGSVEVSQSALGGAGFSVSWGPKVA